MSTPTQEDLVSLITQDGVIESSVDLSIARNWDHDKFVGVLKSLQADERVTSTSTKHTGWKITGEGEVYRKDGSPEAQVYALVKAKGSMTNNEINEALGETAKVGQGTAMKNKWISLDKATKAITVSCDSITDEVQQDLQNDLSKLSAAQLEALKKRKLIAVTNITAFRIEKGPKFNLGTKKATKEITAEMILKGTWKSEEWRPFLFKNVSGKPSTGGHLHPLMKVRAEFREVLLLMGFEEMPTNQYVESSFFNFDSLFQPQQHPARDAHDTFFIDGACAQAQNLPPDYVARVKEMHEKGGQGSIGWRYNWSEDEARKNMLRTHTTAVSARTLYKMGQEYQRTGVFTPKKYFSIDRVFRNETLDATHLAEFHQVEFFVADRNLGLGHLIGFVQEFFRRIGMSNLKYKPAYNPYTEPSMEIFGYHPILDKQVELGNSGVFRPEMLLPMGLPPDVTVIAGATGLERQTAQKYGIRKIHELFSARQDIAKSRKEPVCWLREADQD